MPDLDISPKAAARLADFEDETVWLEQEVNDHGLKVRRCSPWHFQLLETEPPARLVADFWCGKARKFRMHRGKRIFYCKSLEEMLERVLKYREGAPADA